MEGVCGVFGFLNVAKPVGKTSRSVVSRVQSLLKPVKVGHTGTLDPLAAGVLVLAIGPATRLAKYLLHHSKHYEGDFRLGCFSNTDDLEGELEYVDSPPVVTRDQLVGALEKFTGPIEQRPPAYSAIKVNGQRAYRLARRGEEVELPARTVTIYDIELLKYDYPNFKLAIHCSGGTYIRALGRDLGAFLGSAAVMTGLSRTGVGDFCLNGAVPLEMLDVNSIANSLRSPLDVLPDIPKVVLDPLVVQQLLNGVMVELDHSADLVAGLDAEQRLMALLVRKHGSLFCPKTNFSHYWRERGHQSMESS